MKKVNTGKGARRQSYHPSRVAEEGGSMMIHPMKVVEHDSLPLSGLGIQPEVSRRKSELLIITDKISKALEDFDNLYDNNPDESHSVVEDISRQVNDLDSGPLKMQMKSFISNYKDMTTHVETAKNEREEILESLADWFSADHLGMQSMLSFDIMEEEQENEARKEFLETKLGFEKLQRLKKEIKDMKLRGADISELLRQKQKLQQKVINSFKRHNAEKKKRSESNAKPLTEDLGGAWKGAANEICGLLQKVRDQGTDYIAELEKKVKELASSLENEAAMVLKLQASLVESKQMENRWKEDNSNLTMSVARADGRVRKFKKELRKTQKRLSNYEAVVVIPKGDEEEETEDATAHRRNSEAGTIESGSPEITILKTQLKDCRNQLDNLTKEHEGLQAVCEEMRSSLKDKDEQIEGLLYDNSELLQQMKKASVKPDTRRLSSSFHISQESRSRRGSVPSVLFGGSITGSPAPVSSSKTSVLSTLCKKCKAHIANSTSFASSDVESSCSAQSTHLITNDSVETDKDKQIDELSQRCAEYEQTIGGLHEQLARAHQDIASIHRGRTGTRAPCSTPQLKQNLEEISQEEVGSADVKGSVRPDKEVNQLVISEGEYPEDTPVSQDPLLATLQAGKGTNAKSVEHKGIQVHPLNAAGSAEDIYEKYKSKNGKMITITLATRGMQTDPKLDPLGAWSMGVQSDKPGWKPPLPPSSWVDYDPTFGEKQTSDSLDGNRASKKPPPGVAELMLRWEDPAAVRSEAITVANFLERELERIVQGVEGYIEYMNTLVDKETKWMEEANTLLKSHLTAAEHDKLYKILQRPMTSNLFGRQSNLDAAVTGSITVGHTGVNHIQGEGPFHESNLTDSEKSEKKRSASEDHIKDKLHCIANETISTLKKTYRVILNTLQSQHKQYEHIFNIVQQREEENIMPTIVANFVDVDESDDDTELDMKRSLSDSCLMSGSMESSNEPLLKISKMNLSTTNLSCHRSQSNAFLHQTTDGPTTLQVSSQTFLQTHRLDASIPQSSKDNNRIGMATIPKTGMIQLTTGRAVHEMDALQDSVLQKLKTKHRPAPLNHQKLRQKLKTMGKKKTEDAEAPVRGQKFKNRGLLSQANSPFLLQLAGGNDPLDTLQLSDRMLGGYTLGDLERRAEQVIEKSTRHPKTEVLGDLQKVLPPVSPRAASEDKKNALSSDVDPTKLPPIKP